MWRVLFRLIGTRRWRAVGVVLAAFAYVSATVGVLPSPASIAKVSDRLTGERYPCEGGACSCGSAAECWTTCGCQSMEAKLAWAAREGVAVPAWVDVDRDEVAAANGSGGGSCPLCHVEGETRVADGRGAGDRAPTFRTVGCGVLKLLIATPTVPSRAPGADAVAYAPERAAVGRWPRLERVGRLAAEVPVPPPRRAPA